MIGRFMGVEPAGFDPENLHSANRYAYGNNDPYRYFDRDGSSPVKLATMAFKIGKKAIKNDFDFKKAGKGEIASIVDNIKRLLMAS